LIPKLIFKVSLSTFDQRPVNNIVRDVDIHKESLYSARHDVKCMFCVLVILCLHDDHVESIGERPGLREHGNYGRAGAAQDLRCHPTE
jgi:hypothetical protein